MARKELRALAGAAMLLVAAGCSDSSIEPVVPSANTIEAMAGNGQTAEPGAMVAVAPAVLVLDARGRPVAGTVVEFVITGGGGSVSAERASTDAAGLASAGVWRLGAEGTNTVEARVGRLPAVRFTATAVAPGPAEEPVAEEPAPEPPVTEEPPAQTPPPTTTPTTPAPGGFSITVRYIGTPEARHQAAVAEAVARWQSVITSDLGDVPMSSPAGTCFENQPGVGETVDDLLLFVELEPIDGAGKVLGSAGPCYIRTGSGLPIMGYVKLDADDLTMMEGNGTLDDVVLHEIGHVLGIGTLWPQKSLLTGATGPDPQFTGRAAVAAYRSLGGGLAAIPVENTGGAGTRDSHWRESVFGSELMTGYISRGSNPLSAMTIGSLQDLGYGATVSAASGFSLVTATAGVLGGVVELHGREQLTRPKYKVDNRGRKERLQH